MIETYNYVFVNSLVIMNPDKHCTWSKVYLKQIVHRSETNLLKTKLTKYDEVNVCQTSGTATKDYLIPDNDAKKILTDFYTDQKLTNC